MLLFVCSFPTPHCVPLFTRTTNEHADSGQYFAEKRALNHSMRPAQLSESILESSGCRGGRLPSRSIAKGCCRPQTRRRASLQIYEEVGALRPIVSPGTSVQGRSRNYDLGNRLLFRISLTPFTIPLNRSQNNSPKTYYEKIISFKPDRASDCFFASW